MEAAVEAKLRGPHAFALERLLHIFYVIFAQHDAEEEEEEEGGAAAATALQRHRESRREVRAGVGAGAGCLGWAHGFG